VPPQQLPVRAFRVAAAAPCHYGPGCGAGAPENKKPCRLMIEAGPDRLRPAASEALQRADVYT